MLVPLTVLYLRPVFWYHLQFYIYSPYVGTTYSFIFTVHMLVPLTFLYLRSVCWYHLQFYIYGPYVGTTYIFIFTVRMLVPLTFLYLRSICWYHLQFYIYGPYVSTTYSLSFFAIFKPQFGRRLKIFNFIFRFNSDSFIFCATSQIPGSVFS